MRSCRPALSRSARLLLTGLLAGLALATAPAAASASAGAGTGGAQGAGGTGTADAGTADTGTADTGTAARPAVSVSITSVSPGYARPGGKITVTGEVRNGTRAPVSGITVQLRSSSMPLPDRDALTQYVAGTGRGDVPERRAIATINGPVAPGATVPWSAVLPVNEVGMSVFGVYPLAAEAASGGAVLGTSRTLLPYWPGGRPASQPHEQIAWLWPLVDQPDQGPCGLLSNSLAGSLSSSGRLGGLLDAGAGAAGQAAKLTWVIDPALLDSAQAMAGPGSYVTGSRMTGTSAACSPGTSHAASQQAAAWLTRLRTTVASQPAVVTPYADVNIAALVQQNLAGDVHSAYADGRLIAGRVLGRDFEPSAAGSPGSAAALTSALAWPAAGQATYAMLETLAASDGIQAVVLSSATLPPTENVPYTPSAVTSTPDGEGGDMAVLLADSTLTQILGSVPAGSAPGATFAAQQLFLAETAMIAAEAPHLSRAIVVAPPERWDPPASLASGLLADTTSAPWLTPVEAGGLAANTAQATGQVTRQPPPASVGPGLTSPALLRQVAAADRGATLIQSMRVRPSSQLSRAISGIESSAWRGSASGQQQARARLRQVQAYIAAQERGVSIIEPGRDTLGGQTGPIPISVDNRLPYAVRVNVHLSEAKDQSNGFAVLTHLGTIRIPANTVSTTKVRVQAPDIGSTTISLQLLAPDGQAVPGRPVNMTVQATHLGNLTLILIAAALAVFVITSASRAIRRGKPGPADPPGASGPDRPADTAEPARGGGPEDRDEANVTGRGGHERADRRDTVSHDRAASAAAGTDLAATEDADDYARVTGWADRR